MNSRRAGSGRALGGVDADMSLSDTQGSTGQGFLLGLAPNLSAALGAEQGWGGAQLLQSLLPPSLQLNHTHGVSRRQLPWALGTPEAVSGLLGKGTNLKRKRVPSPT